MPFASASRLTASASVDSSSAESLSAVQRLVRSLPPTRLQNQSGRACPRTVPAPESNRFVVILLFSSCSPLLEAALFLVCHCASSYRISFAVRKLNDD